MFAAKRAAGFALGTRSFVVWLLLVPLAPLLSPVIFIACLACRVNPFRALSVLWQVLTALSHTEFELDYPPECRSTFSDCKESS